MEKEKDTAQFEWIAESKKDVIFDTAKKILFCFDEFNKENIDKAVDYASYLYERIYENKKSVEEENEIERDKMTIKYLEETLNTVRSMLDKLCQKYKK